MLKPCYRCDNARLNDELSDNNDFAYFTIGECVKGFRIMLGSGNGKPLRIEFEQWDDSRKQWVTVGAYHPKNCPECGRPIIEYEEAHK